MRNNVSRLRRWAAHGVLTVATSGLSGCIQFGGARLQLDILWEVSAGPGSSNATTLPPAVVGAPYAVRFLPTDADLTPPNCVQIGVTSVDWTINQNLPQGLALSVTGKRASASEVRLSGTPTQAGQFQVTLTVHDFDISGGVFAALITCVGTTKSFNLTVAQTAPLNITTTSLPAGSVGQAYSQMLQATGGTAPLMWDLDPTMPGALPGGLALDANTGVISGTPTAAGTFNFTARVRDSANPQQSDTQALSITIAAAGAAPLAITTASLLNGADDTPYNATITTTGGTAPITFSISAGALPTGMSLDANTGIISGTPTTGGPFGFTLQAMDAGTPPQTAAQAYTVLVLEISTSVLGDGTVGAAYAQPLVAVGQVDPVNWTLASGSLPPGLNLTNVAGGEISGTPTSAGSFNFTVQVTDSDTPPRTDTQALFLMIENPIPAITSLSPTSATLGGPAFTLSVTGSNFVAGSMVRWDGSDRTTTFVSDTALTAAIPASDIAVAGSANVTVFNPPPAGGASNAVVFNISPAATPGVGVLERVTVADDGTSASHAAADELLSDISADADVVVFTSDASNLDGSARCEVYARRISTGDTRCVARGLGDTDPNSPLDAGAVTNGVSLSANGNWVAFASGSTNLVAGDTRSTTLQPEIFVGETCLPTGGSAACLAPLEIVSLMPDGSIPFGGQSAFPSMSGDGRFVSFHSNSDFLGSGGTISDIFDSQIFLRDRQTNQTALISQSVSGSYGRGGSGASVITPSGRFIAFASSANDLVPNDTNGQNDVFVHDTCLSAGNICTPGITRVSVNSTGQEQTGGGAISSPYTLAISDDGRHVAFMSTATNLVPADTNNVPDIFLHDRSTGQTIRVSVAHDGSQSPNPFFTSLGMSGDARLIAFNSFDEALVSGGISFNGIRQIVVRDTCIGVSSACTPTTFLLSQRPDGTVANDVNGSTNERPVLSGDGRFGIFRSRSTNLVLTGNNGGPHIYLAATGR